MTLIFFIKIISLLRKRALAIKIHYVVAPNINKK
jgi:hypothetical protein